MKYRSEIDGLRAVAVVPVILFHAGFLGFSGGYIGVDIFFVISGYLITSILIAEIEQDRFSIIHFYERRARRILPALSVVVLVSTIVAYILMPADLLKSYSQSLVSVATFSSNIFFYLTSGYFSTVSDEKPLLHTWSLSVEEQYYIFFPLLLSMFWFAGKKRIIYLLVTLSVMSILTAQYLSEKGSVNANFYLIFSRAWELFLGSLIAFVCIQTSSLNKWFREFLSILGMCLILYAIAFFDKNTPFPSFYTLIPVLGTCLVILYSKTNSLVGRLLSNRLFVYIGLISYSLYLWHQPLFAFLRMKTIGEPHEVSFLIAIIITFTLSYLSYRYVETPFRNKTLYSRKKIFVYSLISLSIMLIVGLIGHIKEGFKERFSEATYAESMNPSPKREECHTKGENYLAPDDACRYFGEDITWATFGDSHTVEPAFALANLLKDRGEGVLHLSFSGCPPALLFDVTNPGCSKWINESLAYLEKTDSVKQVLLGFRYSAFLFGDQLASYPTIPSTLPTATVFYEEAMSDDVREVYWQSFMEIVSRLRDTGKVVYILYPIPELPIHVSKAVSPFAIFTDKRMLDLERSTTSEYYYARNEYIINKLDSIKYDNGLRRIQPFDIFCEDEYCPATRNEKTLYFDDDHLSVFGASELIRESIGRDIKANKSN